MGPTGCVNIASLLPLAAGRKFTQPRAHLLACKTYINVRRCGEWGKLIPIPNYVTFEFRRRSFGFSGHCAARGTIFRSKYSKRFRPFVEYESAFDEHGPLVCLDRLITTGFRNHINRHAKEKYVSTLSTNQPREKAVARMAIFRGERYSTRHILLRGGRRRNTKAERARAVPEPCRFFTGCRCHAATGHWRL